MLPLYTITIFLSAFLLFAVQPMFTKMVLPRAGGSPAVWNTSVVFFQAVLLAGYLYAHLSTRWLGLMRQTVLHGFVLLTAFLVLPIGIGELGGMLHWTGNEAPPAADSPIPWLLGVLGVSVGIPFFAISATAPLIQKWFANTDHAWSGDPYFLYGGSNLGSLLALLSYPVLVEPMLGVRAQSLVWMAAYALLAACLLTCAVILWRRYRPEQATTAGALETYVTREVTWTVRTRWVLLSLVPSALLLGVTLHIGSYIAAVPFLWIIPLTLYLLTFVFVFARRQWLPRKFWLGAQLLLVPLVAIFFETSQIYVLLVLHLTAMFVSTMVLHGELARLRPPPDRLTEFYFFMSLGGVLGGILSVIVAPLIFDGVFEYPIALLLALLLRPKMIGASALGARLTAWRPVARLRAAVAAAPPILQWVFHPRVLDLALPLLLWVIVGSSRLRTFLVNAVFTVYGWFYRLFGGLLASDFSVRAETLENSGKVAAFVVTLLALMWLGRRRPLRFALAVLAVLLAITPDLFWTSGDMLARIRSFFGVTTIYVARIKSDSIISPGKQTRFHYLVHGVTIHGVQYMEVPRLPVSYYTDLGPIGHFFAAMRAGPNPPHRVGVLGLGAGALACYMQPGDRLTYYEIDPVVEDVARNTEYFRFLEECGSDVVLGDGRLTIGREPDGTFDAIFLDAFSGDGIPVHLLTREAIQLYFRKLAPNGKLMVHITNTFVDLLPVVSDLAKDAGLAALHVDFSPPSSTFFALPTSWVVLARSPADIAPLKSAPVPWQEIGNVRAVRTWTDDFSNVFSALKWGSFGLFPKGIESISSIKVEVAP